jgi:hypothetical protein
MRGTNHNPWIKSNAHSILHSCTHNYVSLFVSSLSLSLKKKISTSSCTAMVVSVLILWKLNRFFFSYNLVLLYSLWETPQDFPITWFFHVIPLMFPTPDLAKKITQNLESHGLFFNRAYQWLLFSSLSSSLSSEK